MKKIIKKKTKLLSYKSLNKENVNHKKLEFTILNTVKGINESIYAYQKQYGNIRKYNYKKKKTYREMVRHYAKLYGIDANKALAIEFLESGYYEQPIAKHYCSVCHQGIYDGEDYIQNNDGECRHYECFYGLRELLKWLGFEIKTMGDTD